MSSHFVVAQVRLKRGGGGVFKAIGGNIGTAGCVVGSGDGLAQTDDGERPVLEWFERCKNLGVVACHFCVSRFAFRASCVAPGGKYGFWFLPKGLSTYLGSFC